MGRDKFKRLASPLLLATLTGGCAGVALPAVMCAHLGMCVSSFVDQRILDRRWATLGHLQKEKRCQVCRAACHGQGRLVGGFRTGLRGVRGMTTLIFMPAMCSIGTEALLRAGCSLSAPSAVSEATVCRQALARCRGVYVYSYNSTTRKKVQGGTQARKGYA